MTRPRFSIVIPTRERAATLAYAMQSVLFQGFDDYELIVQDNCSSPETWEVVRQFRTPKVKYQRSPRVLPMAANWEAALDLCEGEYVFYMGDDDALMPDGMRLASDIFALAPLEVLTWQKYTYWWDNALEPLNRGRLFVHTGAGFQMIDARALLARFYDWSLGFGALPSIYTSFVRRDVIERVRELSGGTYFTSSIPDVWTGIVNCLAATQVGKFERGLSLSGNSGPSTGCAYFFRSKGAERRGDFFKEEGKSVEQLTHPALIPSVNLEILVADQQLRAKELFFPDDPRMTVKIPSVVATMIVNINRDPGSYDDTLADIHALASKHGIDLRTCRIPPKGTVPTEPTQGPVFGADQKLFQLAVNCAEAGVRDVHTAARLTAAMLPVVSINPK